jgi:hypothetical protein
MNTHPPIIIKDALSASVVLSTDIPPKTRNNTFMTAVNCTLDSAIAAWNVPDGAVLKEKVVNLSKQQHEVVYACYQGEIKLESIFVWRYEPLCGACAGQSPAHDLPLANHELSDSGFNYIYFSCDMDNYSSQWGPASVILTTLAVFSGGTVFGAVSAVAAGVVSIPTVAIIIPMLVGSTIGVLYSFGWIPTLTNLNVVSLSKTTPRLSTTAELVIFRKLMLLGRITYNENKLMLVVKQL